MGRVLRNFGTHDRGFDAPPRHLAIVGDAVDAQIAAVQALRNDGDSAAANERIQNEAAVGAAGENAGFHERCRKNGEVGLAELG